MKPLNPRTIGSSFTHRMHQTATCQSFYFPSSLWLSYPPPPMSIPPGGGGGVENCFWLVPEKKLVSVILYRTVQL